METGRSRGLSGSRFAPQNTGYGSGYPTGGGGRGVGSEFDWECASCRFSNFGWRNECLRCNKLKGWTPIDNSTGVQSNNENWKPVSRSDGKSSSFFGLSAASQEVRNANGRPAARVNTEIDEGNGIEPRGALAMSIWAPKNRSASQKYGDKPWTRVSPNTTPKTQPPSSRPPTPPDLGLPYEVQHFILGMMQRILEEGCYDLASRWIPGELLARKWTCSEAVELSAWKKFLPPAIPNNAINPVVAYSLEMGLTDAVRIRNSAVHRHLVDNREIQTLAFKAGNLMEMFRDGSRKEKFERLRFELRRWDDGCRVDRDAARIMLEEALKSIGERPMDDMDWTPNAVSLQEIKDDRTAGLEGGGGSYEYSDEMELD